MKRGLCTSWGDVIPLDVIRDPQRPLGPPMSFGIRQRGASVSATQRDPTVGAVVVSPMGCSNKRAAPSPQSRSTRSAQLTPAVT